MPNCGRALIATSDKNEDLANAHGFAFRSLDFKLLYSVSCQ